MEHHNIKESEQLALLSLSDVTMTKGESKTQKVFIYNSDKESARTITIKIK